MDPNRLLALFRAFDRAEVDYIVLGDLAMLLHGRVGLTERVEIGIPTRHESAAREAFLQAFPGTTFAIRDGAFFRALPPGTPGPLFFDVVAASASDADTMTMAGGVPIRVARQPSQHISPRDDYARPGYTLRDRLGVLQSLARAVVPGTVHPRGVRKYRSIEAAEAERQRRDDLRRARIRAERLRQ